jgi:hypothetical protein
MQPAAIMNELADQRKLPVDIEDEAVAVGALRAHRGGISKRGRQPPCHEFPAQPCGLGFSR